MGNLKFRFITKEVYNLERFITPKIDFISKHVLILMIFKKLNFQVRQKKCRRK